MRRSNMVKLPAPSDRPIKRSPGWSGGRPGVGVLGIRVLWAFGVREGGFVVVVVELVVKGEEEEEEVVGMGVEVIARLIFLASRR
jgi:hypothetical protein